MDDVVEEIWSNFKNEEGLCKGCLNRDKNMSCTPFYGGGSKDADLAFIAITPGEDRPQEVADRDRTENVSDKHSDLDHWHVNSGANLFSRFLRPVIESISTYNSNIEDSLRNEIYYTNGKKCADIDPQSDDLFGSQTKLAEYKNASAYQRCHQYLRPEMEFVDPKVIVTVGQKPWLALCNAFSLKPTGKFAKDHALEQNEIGGYCVIPSYHWNRLGTNYKHIDKPITSENNYLRWLGLEIADALRERGN